ncbi:MAG: helix-turn-helix transcriptional regulator [Tissierellia bacterium]|nr:helix-turn-helix transcriptional regulator [Tissierellia bacterium]
MRNIGPFSLFIIVSFLLKLGVIIYVVYLIIKALKKYINSGGIKAEDRIFVQTLGETLKKERIKKNMTQEFVAEQMGVSRQAVSKWENGKTDPSTSNLLSLCKLYGISPEELLSKVNR